MIPEIGLVICAYVFTRMMELICPPNALGRTVSGVAAGLTAALTALVAVSLLLRGLDPFAASSLGGLTGGK